MPEAKQEKTERKNRNNLWILIVSVAAVLVIVSLIGSASDRISELKMTAESCSVVMGDKDKARYAGTASFETSADETTLDQFTFVSYDENICKIKGTEVKNHMVYFEVTGVNPGMTTVYIETEDGVKSDEMRVSVSETDAYKFEYYVNRALTELTSYLGTLGYTATYLDNDTGEDITEKVDAMSWSEKHEYLVLSVESADDVKKEGTFRIDTKDHVARKDDQERLDKELEAKYPYITAFQDVEKYGQSLYPKGFKLHYVLGQQVAEAVDEHTWHLRASCTITQRDGSTVKKDCDAKISGNHDSYTIVSFHLEDPEKSSSIVDKVGS